MLGTYASMLPGSAADKLVIIEALLVLTQEVEDCVGAEASRDNKIGVVTTLLNNFTTFACCTGYVGLPQVKTQTASGNGRLIAAGAAQVRGPDGRPGRLLRPHKERLDGRVGHTGGQVRFPPAQKAVPAAVGSKHL